MRKLLLRLAAVTASATLFAAVLVAPACVTINVYFPEAEAEKAADQFIQGVWGDERAEQSEDKPAAPQPSQPQSAAAAILDFFVPAARAQPDINISTPAIEAIQKRMDQRFEQHLRKYFQSGAIGLTNDALVKVRDLSAVPLSERNRVQQLVAEENADRRAVYREIAVANGHPEWEDRIRSIFAERWISNARSGWWYQDEAGDWVQK